MTFAHPAAMLAATAMLLGAAGAQAHAKLVSSTPAEGATVAAPKQVTLKFSEKLQPKFSTAHVVMPTMNNMAVDAKTSVGKDGVTMTVTPSKPLMAGAYAIEWTAVAADTHKMTGKLSFTVK